MVGLGVAGIGRALVGTSARFRELDWQPTMARTNDALSVEDVVAARGGVAGVEGCAVLGRPGRAAGPDGGRVDHPTGGGPLGTLEGSERGTERVAPKFSVDPEGECRGEDPQAP